MADLFGGGEMGAFVPSDANVIEVTASGTFDSTLARCSIAVATSVSYAESQAWTSEDDLWLHFDVKQTSANNNSTIQSVGVLVDGSNVERFRLACNTADNSAGTGLWALQYNIGAGWVDFGTQFTASFSTLQTIDVHIVCNSASGSGALYLSGTKRIEGTAVDLSTITGLTKLRLYGKTTTIGATNYFSQVLVSDESTVSARLKTIPPTSAGADAAWTGTYAEVDEIVYSDLDFINSSVADQVETFAHTTTLPTGYSVRSVLVTARAKKGGSGPTNLQLALRSGGTNYFTGSQALDSGYGAHVGIWNTDPATAAEFTSSAIASLQFGVKSIA